MKVYWCIGPQALQGPLVFCSRSEFEVIRLWANAVWSMDLIFCTQGWRCKRWPCSCERGLNNVVITNQVLDSGTRYTCLHPGHTEIQQTSPFVGGFHTCWIMLMGFAVRVRSAGQKYGPTCHQRDRADVTEFVTLVRLSSLGQHVGVLALAGYKRRKSALTAGPIVGANYLYNIILESNGVGVGIILEVEVDISYWNEITLDTSVFLQQITELLEEHSCCYAVAFSGTGVDDRSWQDEWDPPGMRMSCVGTHDQTSGASFPVSQQLLSWWTCRGASYSSCCLPATPSNMQKIVSSWNKPMYQSIAYFQN